MTTQKTGSEAMGITERLAEWFPRAVRARGESYLDRVRIVGSEEERVTAGVAGTRQYRVRLEHRAGLVLGSCDCPYFADVGPCKHLWATLIVVERRGLLPGARRSGRHLAFREKLDGASTGAGQPPASDEENDWDEDDEADRDDEANEKGDEEEEEAQDEPSSAAERGVGRLDRRPPVVPPLRVALPPSPSFAEIALALQRERHQPSPPSRRAATIPLVEAPWRRFVESVGRALEQKRRLGWRWPAEHRILYIVDLAETVRSGALVIDLAVQDRKRDGSFTKPSVAVIPRDRVPELPDADDRRILTALGAVQAVVTYGSWTTLPDVIPARRTLGRPLPVDLLATICRTGRARLRRPPRGELGELSWDDDPPWVFELQLRRAAERCVLDGVLRRGESSMPVRQPELVAGDGLVAHEGRLAQMDDRGASPWLLALRRDGVVTAPWSDADAVVQALCDLPSLPPLSLPEELGLDPVRLRPIVRLRLEEAKESWRRLWTASLSFRYGELEVPERAPGAALLDRSSHRVLLRDGTVEREAGENLSSLGARRSQTGPWTPVEAPGWSVYPNALPALVRGLVDAGWLVEAEGKPYRPAGAFRLEVSTGIDWFDLDGGVEFGDQVAKLPDLLAALRRGERFVRLSDGSMGMLPEDWLAQQGLFLGLATPVDGKLRFRRSQAGLLDVLLASQPEASWDAGFGRVRRELESFDRVRAEKPARGFSGELRKYQRLGLGWMRFLRRFGFGGCLADDMGLGKTVQVLALLWARRRELAKGASRTSLVVVPRSLIFNWKAEAKRFAPELRVLDLSGDRTARAAQRLEDHDLVLTTYGLLRQDAARLKDVHFDYVILDEAQAIKNESSIASKAARLLRADHRLALSGTPIENHLGELWSLFEFLNPGLLGSTSAFRGGAAREPDERTCADLARALKPFFLRRTKAQVAPDLPPRVEQTLWCELGRSQRASYDELRDHYRAALLGRIDREGLAESRMHVLEALLRLRQVACHPGLLDPNRAGEDPAKLTMLLEQLEPIRCSGSKALVFSQFTSLLDLVAPHLEAAGFRYERLDGRTADREARVAHFRTDPDCSLFLISLKAGGLGLNLTEAQYVFLLDPWWNPAAEAQAIDRTHRIGQRRTVFAYRLVARATIEEKILELQAKKRALADAILGASGRASLRTLTRADIELLLD